MRRKEKRIGRYRGRREEGRDNEEKRRWMKPRREEGKGAGKGEEREGWRRKRRKNEERRRGNERS